MVKSPRPSPKPEAVWHHATCFLVADKTIRDASEQDPTLGTLLQYPGMVNSTFASELLFKCLLRLEGKPLPAEHNLRKLFDQLSEDAKDKIRAEWDEANRVTKEQIKEMERQHNISIPRDIETALQQCGDAFRVMRYLYEDRSKGLFYITHLPVALRRVIMAITGWK